MTTLSKKDRKNFERMLVRALQQKSDLAFKVLCNQHEIDGHLKILDKLNVKEDDT